MTRHKQWLDVSIIDNIGIAGPTTEAAIVSFQKNACSLLRPDGLVSVGGFTSKRLSMAIIPRPLHRVFAAQCWNHPNVGLPNTAYATAAKTLDCEVAAVTAVAKTETQRASWDNEGRPTILYERHYFSGRTNHVFDRTHPDISNKTAGGYGRFSEQYPKLYRAAVLDEHAALQSASWGTFQIMGANFKAAGFQTVEDFVSAMLDSEQRQLDAFVSFIANNPTLKTALHDKRWAAFARIYNGPNYRDNDYDTILGQNYNAAAAGR